ncbi:MAG: two-component sensor histidine kinase [Nocardioides sp.]|nr:two-component sensor histidine kinase [Nocardioides sp.]
MLPRLRRRLASLTSRLVVTAVALVLGVSLLIGAVTALAVDSYLTGKLDADVRSSADRATIAPLFIDSDGTVSTSPPDDDGDDFDGRGPRRTPEGQGVGTLTAYLVAASDVAGLEAQQVGNVLVDSAKGQTTRSVLSTDALEVLDDVPDDGEVHEVDVPGFGTYRVVATEIDAVTNTGAAAPYTVVSGLPTNDVQDIVRTLVTWEAALVLAGALLAALAGVVLVRRQLRPLTEVARTAHSVAALPLSSGAISLDERVPEHLTAEDTEVGHVGAALNTLLEHVESSLEARHASEQRVRQFVADASHELRTPLTTIAGYTELARRRPDPDTSATALTKVEEEAARMTALVEDLLLLARLDSGRPLTREPVDLTRLLLEAVSDARVVSPEHRWQLELPDEALEVLGDEQRLHQVVTNLLTNARKYTPDGTTVTVRARQGGFEVHDDGPGFPPELVPRAFERFTRADTARVRAGGVGLGLSLVQAIVTAHGGTVTLSSQPGDTTISVRLPEADAGWHDGAWLDSSTTPAPSA